MKNGDIYIAERTTGPSRWITKVLANTVVSSIAKLASDGSQLLIIADNGYALALDMHGTSTRPVGIGNEQLEPDVAR